MLAGWPSVPLLALEHRHADSSSALVVIFAGIGSIPVGPLLIATIIPGIVVALSLTFFIVLAAK